MLLPRVPCALEAATHYFRIRALPSTPDFELSAAAGGIRGGNAIFDRHHQGVASLDLGPKIPHLEGPECQELRALSTFGDSD